MSVSYSKWPFGTIQFREYVNHYADILVLLSNEQDNKNYWNCVCSAMDWMDLAIEHLETSDISSLDWHQYSLQIYMHISLIDIVWECIIQLHKMFIDEESSPFEKDNSIFQDVRLKLDDNRYFKHLRAAFGAHPVDLIEERKKGLKKTIRYASWPTAGIDREYDYSVLLYSGRKDRDDVSFGFKVKQLTTFFELRYKYLEKIEEAIKEMCKEHLAEKKSIEIRRVKDPLEQLEILEKENSTRLNNEHYQDIIHMLTVFFQTDFSNSQNSKAVEKFTSIMKVGVGELFDKISNMQVEHLRVAAFLNPNYPKWNDFGYCFAKLSARVLAGSNKPLPFTPQEIIEPIKKYLSFSYNTEEELYWLIVIALNINNGKL